jgi:3,4-dihydroxy-2-butanone 4-phosphate synthase
MVVGSDQAMGAFTVSVDAKHGTSSRIPARTALPRVGAIAEMFAQDGKIARVPELSGFPADRRLAMIDRSPRRMPALA